MIRSRKNRTRNRIWILSAVAAALFMAGIVLILKVLVSGEGGRRVRQIHTVTLLKPPPPPPVQEKPPEQEVQKEEEKPPPEVEEEVAQEPVQEDGLGLDADGGAGSDAFGLLAKKGGKPLLGGDFETAELLRKYAWYVRIVQDDIRKKVHEHLDRNGGLPDGGRQILVRIVLDEQGVVRDYEIYGSSGDPALDRAVGEVLKFVRLSEPPPQGMPRTMKLRISSQG